MQLTPTANGYVATWLPGGASAYLAPSFVATSLAPDDDGDDTITPTVPLTLPGGGSSVDLTISHNGIITAASFANNPFDYVPDGSSLAAAPDNADLAQVSALAVRSLQTVRHLDPGFDPGRFRADLEAERLDRGFFHPASAAGGDREEDES